MEKNCSLQRKEKDHVWHTWSDVVDAFMSAFDTEDIWPGAEKRITDIEPKFNVHETDDEYEISACLPGYSKEDVSIKLSDDNVLTIVAAHQNKKERESTKEYKSQHYEFSIKECCQKSIMLTEEVQRDKITAKCENGILNITLPKKRPVQPEEKIMLIPIQ